MKLFLERGRKFCFRVAPLLKPDSAVAGRPPTNPDDGTKRYSVMPG